MSDPVNPNHYKNGRFEVIDVIEDQLSREQFIGYLRGNVIKYQSRYRLKGGVVDLKKCEWYLQRLIRKESENVEK